jgi:cytochrome b561
MTVTRQPQFPIFSRMLHRTMAVLVLAMLFIGIGIVSSLSGHHWLVSTPWPLGVRNDRAAARDRRCGSAAGERRGPSRPAQGTPPVLQRAQEIQ